MVIGADVDDAVGDGGRRFDAITGSVVPQVFSSGGVQGIETVVIRAEEEDVSGDSRR